MSDEMRRSFRNRQELSAYVRESFPHAAAIDDHISPILGGPAAAQERLEQIEPERYDQTRNHTGGAVNRLSPYIRHGVLSLAQVREKVSQRQKIPRPGKLLQQLAWRDYFQRLYTQMGRDIWRDQELYKTGFFAADYAADLPEDIRRGQTGLPCVDQWVRELLVTGYLHNHARMWLAGYIIHWRRIRWQAGARWFLQHLLDGDPASNNLSWQWVASTFSHKPYYFNRENIERFTDGAFCAACPLYGRCTFEGSYPTLEKRLFPHKPPSPESTRSPQKRVKQNKRWHQ